MSICCRVCGETKPAGEFRPQRRRCRKCDAKHAAEKYSADPAAGRASVKRSREKNLARALISGARKRAIKKGIAFDLFPHLPVLRERLAAGLCEVTGIPFQIGNGHHWASPAIDRIDPRRGYEIDNVRIILHGLNNALGNWGEEVLLAMTDALRSRK